MRFVPVLGRRASRTDDLSPTGAREPDIPVVLPTIQIPAPLVLSDERYKGVQQPFGEMFSQTAGLWRRLTIPLVPGRL